MEQEVKNIIRIFNEAWLNAEWEVIEALLHEEVVFASMDEVTTTPSLRGRNQCMQSIKRFVYQAAVRHFEIEKEQIQIWGNTAKVEIQYLVRYEMHHKRFRERCTEIWFLSHPNENWKIVWRALIQRLPLL